MQITIFHSPLSGSILNAGAKEVDIMPVLWELKKYGYLVILWQNRRKLQGKREFREACLVWSKGENKMSIPEHRLSEQACKKKKKICRLYPESRRKCILSRQSAKAGHIRKVQTVWQR